MSYLPKIAVSSCFFWLQSLDHEEQAIMSIFGHKLVQSLTTFNRPTDTQNYSYRSHPWQQLYRSEEHATSSQSKGSLWPWWERYWPLHHARYPTQARATGGGGARRGKGRREGSPRSPATLSMKFGGKSFTACMFNFLLFITRFPLADVFFYALELLFFDQLFFILYSFCELNSIRYNNGRYCCMQKSVPSLRNLEVPV